LFQPLSSILNLQKTPDVQTFAQYLERRQEFGSKMTRDGVSNFM
jgi:hypothetical protein